MSIHSVLMKGCRSIADFTSKNSPAILTGMVVVGVISTAVLTAVATVKSQDDILDKDEETGDFLETATKKDIVKLCWPNYIPAAISGVATIACAIGAQHINHRRQVALAAAYELADTALREYKAQVIEQIGKNKEDKIQSSIDKKHLEENPPDEKLVLSLTDADILFREPITGQEWKSNIDRVKAAARKVNDDMDGDPVLLNDFLYAAGANMCAVGNSYYFDSFKTGKIDVDSFIHYEEIDKFGHTFICGYLRLNPKHDTYK